MRSLCYVLRASGKLLSGKLEVHNGIRTTRALASNLLYALCCVVTEFSGRLQALKPWYIINPDSSGLANTWQLLTMCALGFVGLVTPVQAGSLKS